MSISRLAMMGAAGAGGGVDVADVFSTDLYTGNYSTQTITNGIDLLGEGGMVWTKRRDTTGDHAVVDTARGPTSTSDVVGNGELATNSTAAGLDTDDFDAYLADGFRLRGNTGTSNTSGGSYAAWTFRQAPRFFDVVTYTGDGTAGRTISHNLGVTPGMIVVKRRDSTGGWSVYHRSAPQDNANLYMDTTGAGGPNQWSFGDSSVLIHPTDSVFTVGVNNNASGGTYVAYLFAHDDADDGIIQCGSYTGNGSTTGPTITLGWEPQYVMFKRSDGAGVWYLFDSARGAGAGNDAYLAANTSNAETSSFDAIEFMSTGFQLKNTDSTINASGGNYIYMAIRAEGV